MYLHFLHQDIKEFLYFQFISKEACSFCCLFFLLVWFGFIFLGGGWGLVVPPLPLRQWSKYPTNVVVGKPFSREILKVRGTGRPIFVLAAVANTLFDPDVTGPSRCLLSEPRRVSADCKCTRSQIFCKQNCS